MKFNINRPTREERIRRKIRHQQEWHPRFAWWPTVVDAHRESYSVVLFEKYFRKLRSGSPDPSKRWETISKHEYFRRKLNGDFDFNSPGPEATNKTQDDVQSGPSGIGGAL